MPAVPAAEEGACMGILFIDIDGTLLNSRNIVTNRTRTVLRRASEAGHVPVLCSGRCLDGLSGIMSVLGMRTYAATLNGACIFAMDGSIVSSTPLDPEAISICLDLAGRMGMDYLYFFSSRWGADGFNDCYELERRIVGTEGVAEPVDLMAAKTSVHKFLAIGSPSCCGSFLAESRTLLPSYSIVPSSSRYVEVNAPGIDKGFAVRTVCGLLGADISDSICFGDYDNDLAMFGAAGYAVAMGNAPGYVRMAADEVCPSNDEDGLAIWIENNLLNR